MGSLSVRYIKEAWIQLLLLLFLVTFCIALTINFHPLYWWFMHHYKLYKEVGLTEQGLRENYLSLLAYLNYPWVTDLKLSLPISYNGMRHFEDVKQLFFLNYIVLVLTAWPALHYLYDLTLKKRLWILQAKIYGLSLILAGGICFITVDFEDFFIFFHEVLFRNDDWIFDPNLDPIINALPSEYFLACFCIFVVIFALSLLSIYIVGKWQLKNVVA